MCACTEDLYLGIILTGSYVADLDKELGTYWVTGSSTPCISVFKPLWLTEDETITFKEGEEESAINY